MPGVCKGQEKGTGSSGAGVMFVNIMWVLEIEPGSSSTTANVLSH